MSYQITYCILWWAIWNLLGKVNPQQKRRSIAALKSLSAKEGPSTCDRLRWWDGVCGAGVVGSSSSSSSITNCGAGCSGLPGLLGASSEDETASFFQRSSCSRSGSSFSNMTGSTRWSTRRQLSTSLVGFRSLDAPINEVAIPTIEGWLGNVWSPMRTNRRPQRNRTRVTMFSGASTSARRTRNQVSVSNKAAH